MLSAHRSRRISWSGVPESYWSAWQAVFSRSPEMLDLPDPCPICDMPTLHRYYHMPHRDPAMSPQRLGITGSLWQWCSTCRSYLHFSGRFSIDSSTALEVATRRLGHDPDPIEEARLARSFRDPAAVEAAERTILAIPDAWERQARLVDFATALAAAGYTAHASSVARSIGNASLRAHALDAISSRLLEQRQHDLARQLLGEAEIAAEAIDRLAWRCYRLSLIATTYVAAGMSDDALRIWEGTIAAARAGEDSETGHEREVCSRVLGDIAEELAKLGQVVRAKEVARPIKTAYWREYTLNNIGRVVRYQRRRPPS